MMKAFQNELLTVPATECFSHHNKGPSAMPKELTRLKLIKENIKRELLRKQRLQTCTVQSWTSNQQNPSMNLNDLEDTTNIWKASKILKELYLNFYQYSSVAQEIFDNTCGGLSELKSLRSLSLELMMHRNVFNEGGEYFSKALRRMLNLERLNLYLTAFNNLDATVMNCLEKGLRTLPSFHHLNITLKCNDLSDATFKRFGKLLANLKHLKHLDILISSCSTINSAVLVSLGEELGKASNLQHLTVNFEYCQDISLEKLHEKICEIGSLKSFKIGVKKPLGGLSHSLNGLDRLKPLEKSDEIVFGPSIFSEGQEKNVRQLSQETLRLHSGKPDIMKTCLEEFPELRSLSLYNIPWMGDKGSFQDIILNYNTKKCFLEMLLQNIQVKIDHPLRRLYIEISNSHQSWDHSLIYLADNIQQSTPFLEVLSFKFLFCAQLTFDCFRFLVEGGCQKLKNLRSLAIHFSKNGSQFNYQRQFISKHLNILFDFLKQLDKTVLETRDLQAGTKIDCLGLIANSIYFLTTLKAETCFKTAKKITKAQLTASRELNPLREKLNKMLPSLLDKNLQFSEADFLVHLQDLNRILKELQVFADEEEDMSFGGVTFESLEKLTLIFEDFIFDNGLQYLGEVIKKNPSLKEIDLNFSNCKDLTVSGFAHLADALKSLRNLKSLKLNFFGCSKTTTPTMMALENDLKHTVPSMKFLKPSQRIF